ncbi:MAG: dihydropteroate synthase [Vulcanimicrobiaceae bacterium]
MSRVPVANLRLRPAAIIGGTIAKHAVARGKARPLAGSALAFGSVELLARTADGIVSSVAALPVLLGALKGEPECHDAVEAALQRLSAPRSAWAGFSFRRPLIMGILNVTPDSFSDGGRFLDPARAIAHGRALLESGADIIDVGGDSTRPGAAPAAPDEECARIEPVIRALANAGATISVDTQHPATMERALAAGARIINDIHALAHPGSLAIAAKAGASVVLMHMLGEPQTMQQAPQYKLASLEILEFLEARVAACTRAGISRTNIVVDPGIGFGKTRAHNLEILARIALFHGLGIGVLVGFSRKSFLQGPVDTRLPGSLAVAVHAVERGVQILRVHDVAETRAAVALTEALASAF